MQALCTFIWDYILCYALYFRIWQTLYRVSKQIVWSCKQHRLIRSKPTSIRILIDKVRRANKIKQAAMIELFINGVFSLNVTYKNSVWPSSYHLKLLCCSENYLNIIFLKFLNLKTMDVSPIKPVTLNREQRKQNIPKKKIMCRKEAGETTHYKFSWNGS